MGDHTRYFGWSDDRTIATADLTAAAESDDNSGVIPARTANGYLFFAIPETIGYPASVSINNGPNQIAGFEELADTVDDAQGHSSPDWDHDSPAGPGHCGRLHRSRLLT